MSISYSYLLVDLCTDLRDQGLELLLILVAVRLAVNSELAEPLKSDTDFASRGMHVNDFVLIMSC